MRLFLAVLTVGAVGIGYATMHQAAQPAADSQSTASRPLFDWQSADDTLSAAASGDVTTPADDPPLVVRDTINSARSEVTSVLDEFVRVNGNSNPVPLPTDIVTQADHPGDVVRDEPSVPFATSDPADLNAIKAAPAETRPDNSSPDFGPADASAAVNQAQPNLPAQPDLQTGSNPTPLKVTDALNDTEAGPVTDAAVKQAKPAPGKPAINEATLVTKKANPQSEPIPQTPSTPPTPSTSLIRQPEVAAKPSKTELLPGGKMPEKQAVFDPEWKVIGKTNNDLPMHTRRFGRQGTRTLIIAGLDGNDRIATRWNDELADALIRHSDLLKTNEVLLVRAGNPDGLVKKMPGNAHGVLINRNFPSRRYQFLPDKSAGPGPASEAETHAILDVLYSFRPRRVVHLTSTTGRSTVIYNRAGKETAAALQKQFQLNGQPLDVELVPGSLEDFADGTLDAAVISLKLNTGTEWQQAWQKHVPAVLTAINGQLPLETVSQDELAKSSPDQAGTRIPNMDDEEPAPLKKRRRGYEELPPPPR